MYRVNLLNSCALVVMAVAVAFSSSAHQTSRTIECQDMSPYPGCCTAVSPSAGSTPPPTYVWWADGGYHDPDVTMVNYTHFYCDYWGGNAEQWNAVVDADLDSHGHVMCPTP